MKYGEVSDVKLSTGEVVRGIKCTIVNPPKTAVVRLPTSAELLERLGSQKSIRRTLGRRKSQTEWLPNREADLALFKKIRLDSGEEFDPYEAEYAITRLVRAEATDCEQNGDGYVVTIKTSFGETKHHLGLPTLQQASQYRRGIVTSTDLPRGQEEIIFHLEPAVKLYDAVAKSQEGYAEGCEIPPNHKSAAVIELVQAADDFEASLDPNS